MRNSREFRSIRLTFKALGLCGASGFRNPTYLLPTPDGDSHAKSASLLPQCNLDKKPRRLLATGLKPLIIEPRICNPLGLCGHGRSIARHPTPPRHQMIGNTAAPRVSNSNQTGTLHLGHAKFHRNVVMFGKPSHRSFVNDFEENAHQFATLQCSPRVLPSVN